MTTREHIVKAAGTVFEKFGFKKASMADIAHAARKGRRTVYLYFKSKEEIFRAVIDTEVNALAGKLEEIAGQAVSPEEKLRTYMHARMNAVRELSMYYDALRQDLLNNMDVVEKIREEYDIREIELIRSILEEGKEAGIFDIDEPRLVAEAMVLAIKGFEIPLFMGYKEYDQERLIDPLLNLLYSGIKKSKSSDCL